MPNCIRCGKSGFHWQLSSKKKWRLYDNNGVIHTCFPRSTPEEFKSLLHTIANNLKLKAQIREERV